MDGMDDMDKMDEVDEAANQSAEPLPLQPTRRALAPTTNPLRPHPYNQPAAVGCLSF